VSLPQIDGSNLPTFGLVVDRNDARHREFLQLKFVIPSAQPTCWFQKFRTDHGRENSFGVGTEREKP
jgi:hypothetical protein